MKISYENALKWCENHEGENIADHEDIEWLDYYPVVDPDGLLTGEVVDGNSVVADDYKLYNDYAMTLIDMD